MRYIVSAILASTLVLGAGAGFAHHKDGHSAPGQQAKAEDATDVNGDGRINGKDYAPGQNKD